jgi:tRNA threonylcarbamoyladenosine biosynthesis protein TsaB
LSSSASSGILAIDTASPKPGVSVLTDRGTFDEPLPPERQASERLLPAIEACLRAAGLPLRRVSRIAACAGPGSFTGVRVGLATAWGLARATGAAVEPVSTLEVLAESARGRATRVAAALDAGRGEVVWQAFDLSGARPVPLEGEGAEPERATPSEAARRMRDAGIETPCVTLPAELLGSDAETVAPTEPPARVLARLVARAPSPPALLALSAIYARPSAAEEKHGRP